MVIMVIFGFSRSGVHFDHFWNPPRVKMFEYFRLWVQARVKNVTPKNVQIFGEFWKKNLGNPFISGGDIVVYFWKILIFCWKIQFCVKLLTKYSSKPWNFDWYFFRVNFKMAYCIWSPPFFVAKKNFDENFFSSENGGPQDSKFWNFVESFLTEKMFFCFFLNNSILHQIVYSFLAFWVKEIWFLKKTPFIFHKISSSLGGLMGFRYRMPF